MELEKVLSDSFTRMVWKRTLKVSFGIKGRWVYARYCTAEGNKGTVKEWQSNVEEDCVKDDVDVCFQRAALRAHNEKRARHRGGRPLQAYPAASRHLARVLSKSSFTGEIILPPQFSDCGVNVYTITGTDAELKSMERETKATRATEAWYSG